jgi:hypothetical protein
MNQLTKCVIALGLMLGCSQGFAFECRGDVVLPVAKFMSSAYLSIPASDISQVTVGSFMSLGSPITMDTENEMQLDVLSVVKIEAGVQVIAKAHGEDGIYSLDLTSENGVTQVTNFKGFEANVPFGPATLICK